MEPLGDEFRQQLRRFGIEGGLADLVDAWPEAVGAEIARNAWPARMQADGTLVVNARDAIWGFELTQRASEISARLPGSPRLRFVSGPLPAASEAPSRRRSPTSQASCAQVEEAAGWAAPISDAELREAVARAAAASLARGTGRGRDDRAF